MPASITPPAGSTVARIPDDLDFSALKLARDPATGAVDFDWQPIEAICRASSLDVALFRDGPEDNTAAIISAWYAEHLARGGARDATMDDLIAEAAAEDRAGGGYSHQPGRA